MKGDPILEKGEYPSGRNSIQYLLKKVMSEGFRERIFKGRICPSSGEKLRERTGVYNQKLIVK